MQGQTFDQYLAANNPTPEQSFQNFANAYVRPERKQNQIDMQAQGQDYAQGSEQQFLNARQPQPQPQIDVQTQTTERVADPKLLAELNAANALQQKAIAQQADAEADVNAMRAEAYQQQAKLVEKRQAELDGIISQYKEAKVTDPTDKWGTAGKIGAAIAMGLGAYAAAYTGSRNYAAEIIQDTIKRDMDLQEAKINKLGLDAKNAQGSLADATRRLGDIGSARTALEIAALTKANADIMKTAQATDNKKVQANAQTLIAANNQAIAEKKMILNQKNITTSISSARPGAAASAAQGQAQAKPMTEAQSKAYAYVQSMKQAETDISELQEYGAEISSGLATMLPKAAQSEKRQRLDLASNQFAEGYIRFASGANVPEHEVKATLSRAMPQAGDKTETLAKKAAYRQQLIQSMEAVAMGRADMSTFGQQSQTAKNKEMFGFK